MSTSETTPVRGLRFVAHPAVALDELAAPWIHVNSTAAAVRELGCVVVIVRFGILESLLRRRGTPTWGPLFWLLSEFLLPWFVFVSCLTPGLIPYIRHYYDLSPSYFLLALVRRRFVVEINATLREEAHLLSRGPAFLLRIARRWETAALRRADVVITVSEVMRARLVKSGLDASRVFAVHNGCDCPRQVDEVCDEDTSGILYVGNFKPWHRVDLLVDALASLEDGARVLLAGRGDTATTRARADELGVADRVEFLGPMDRAHVQGRMRKSRVLVLPHTEDYGSPMKLFEYLASGRPTVLPDLPNVREVVTHEEHALLFRPGDRHELARCLRLLLGDRELRSRLGSGGRALVCNEYTWGKNAERTLDAVSNHIGQLARRRGGSL
ncbi:MAG: glycosyltransferase family 4 protein [Candidatus Eisenbacteria sp.]|nr:glycosyltransferase family 4 protein [Candidatus Eisenbacteria bacterium]